MDDRPVYIVSGYMRSGTSMMMRCIEAGGIPAGFEPKRDELNDKFGDENYKPNPAGFYEFGRDEYKEPYFPSQHKGTVIKCLLGGILARLEQYSFPVGNYKIIFMKRDPEEIRQSYEAFFEPRVKDVIHMKEWLRDQYESKCDYAISQLSNRKDTTVTVVNYRDVVEDPVREFQRIHIAGWPIKIHAASAPVDKSQCRFKKEALTIGI